MAETEIPAAASGGLSSLQLLIRVLTSPREGFTALAARPLFALALALLVGVGVVAIRVTMSRVTPEEILRSVEAGGNELPAEARENPERFHTISVWSQTAAAVVLGPLVYLAAAGILLVLLRLLGAELSYRQSLATTVHGMLPLGIAALAGIVVALGRESISIEELRFGGLLASHLGVLAGEETGKIALALLTSVDLFSVWCVTLLAIGYRTVARVSSATAWSVVLSVWFAGVLVKVALTAAF